MTAPTDVTSIDFARFSTVSGELTDPPDPDRYRVDYRSVVGHGLDHVRSLLLVAAAFVAEMAFLLWLLQPGHLPPDSGDWTYRLALGLVVSAGIIEALRLVNVATLVRATMVARHPVPVRPETGRRIAYLTTIVPDREPIELVRRTLEAAVALQYDGRLDVWLLDEGNDPDVKAMCAELGVHHFSRKGVHRWNQVSGPYRRKTKHGNYNAWLDAHGDGYDFWVSTDTDMVPLPQIIERLVGYFRDPDVAFVVGPQVYGNYDNLVTRWAESQQFLFHSTLQPAANKHSTAMFVGTNNAVRISALKAIGGLADSVTEDAATSIVWHSSRNPRTGRRWKSVYTPDVLAIGEGPSTWGAYFVQQNRWARGTDEVVLRRLWRTLPRLSFGRALHYVLLMSYYPSAALSWVLGSVNLLAYLVTGTGGVMVAANLWAMLYVNAAVLQLGVYLWNRRYSLSPFEEAGAAGAAGMFISVLSAPVYVTALLDAVRGRNAPFAVTPKGSRQAGGDTIRVFRRHLLWGALLLAGLLVSVPLGHTHPAMRGWAALEVAVAFCPVVLWGMQKAAARWAARRGDDPGRSRAPDLREEVPRGTGQAAVLRTDGLEDLVGTTSERREQ